MKLKFAKKTKIRIIANGVGVFTTVGKYAELFINGAIVNATLTALLEIQRYREAGEPVSGLVGNWFNTNIQVDLL